MVNVNVAAKLFTYAVFVFFVMGDIDLNYLFMYFYRILLIFANMP